MSANRRQGEAGLKEMLETIRACATQALEQLDSTANRHSGRRLAGESSEELKSLRWQCTGCGHTKFFTTKVPAEVAPPCPKCRGTDFKPLAA